MKLENGSITISFGYYSFNNYSYNVHFLDNGYWSANVEPNQIFDMLRDLGFLSKEKAKALEKSDYRRLCNQALLHAIRTYDEKGKLVRADNELKLDPDDTYPYLIMTYYYGHLGHKTLFDLAEQSQDDSISHDIESIEIRGDDCFEKFLDLAVAAYEKDHEKKNDGKGGKE